MAKNARVTITASVNSRYETAGGVTGAEPPFEGAAEAANSGRSEGETSPFKSI